jgi:hypothetical protein
MLAGSSSLIGERPGMRCVERQGLFDPHVLAGREGLHRMRMMLRGRRRDGDGFDRRIVED